MNLYVWNDPYHLAYGSSILYVIAPNEDVAREKALSATHATYGSPESKPIRIEGLGAPDRVIALGDGYAEVYEWQE